MDKPMAGKLSILSLFGCARVIVEPKMDHTLSNGPRNCTAFSVAFGRAMNICRKCTCAFPFTKAMARMGIAHNVYLELPVNSAIARLSTLVVLFALLSAQTVLAASSMWKVSSDKHYFYLGGTIHVLSNSDHPLPPEFNQAYRDADTLVLETDLAALQSPSFMLKMMQAMSLPAGQQLQQVLDQTTYTALSDFFDSRGMNIATFASISPSGISLMLATMEFQRLGMSLQAGVDITFHNMAKADNKKQVALETADEQIAFLTNLGKGNENETVLYTLRDLEKLPSIITELKAVWRAGDLQAMQSNSLAELQKEFPEVYRSLVLNRNNAWMKKLEPLLKSPEKEVILVGALHLAGENGLIAQFRKRGYTVTQLDTKKSPRLSTTAP